MAELPAARSVIQSEQVDLNSPHSESLNTDYGGNINDYLEFSGAYTMETFTSNGTYTVPDNAAFIIVEGIGGGGGGGQTVNSLFGADGGNAGVYGQLILPVTPEASLSVVIGAGGAGGAGGSNDQGSDGADTTLGSIARFKGGAGGGVSGVGFINTYRNSGAKGGLAGVTSTGFLSEEGEGQFASGGSSPNTVTGSGGGGAGLSAGGSTSGSGFNALGLSGSANSGAGGGGGGLSGSTGSGGSGFMRIFSVAVN